MKKNKFLNILYKIFTQLFFAAVVLVVILLIMSRYTMSDKFHVLIVQSGSMEPAIHTGAVVVVVKTNDYQVGDIITFGEMSRRQTPTTHRIMEIQNDNGRIQYITQGDANDSVDFEAVAYKDVVGKVLFSVPYFGYIVDMAKKPWGFAAIIGLPALVVITDEIKKIIDELKKKKIGKDNDL